MSSPLQTDVLVVGGGPCGLMLANELGRRAIRCLVVDRKGSTAFNPQANATQARTMEHYRRLGFAQAVRAQGLPVDHPTDVAYLTRFAGHELARLRLPTAAQAALAVRNMGGSWSAAELPHRVSQKFVEVVLREQAQRLAGVDLRYGWELREFIDLGDAVEATLAPVAAPVPAGVGDRSHEARHAPDDPDAASPAGRASLRVRAAWMVAADGARSGVRARLGIGWEGATGIRRRFMGGRMMAVYLRAPDFYRLNPNDRAWMYVQVHPAQRAFIMSVDGVSEFAFHVQLPDERDPSTFTQDDARAAFAMASGLQTPIEILSMAPWLAGHALVASHFGRGRVLLGGDAAHLFTPTGGLGYNTAVEDAVNLGWKLAAVIKGQAPPALMQSYERERKAVALRNTAYARAFADSIGLFEAVPELDDDTPAGCAARALATPYLEGHARREFNIPGVTFGARYDGSPIIVPDGSSPPPDEANAYTHTACPGGRPPHAWLDDGASLYDRFGFEWTLLQLEPGLGTSGAVASFEAAATELGLDLRVLTLERQDLRALYEAPLALIRPDHVVAWRGDATVDARRVLRIVLGWEDAG